MRRTWRLIKRWVLPFLPCSSSFPFPGGLGGLGSGRSFEVLVALTPAASWLLLCFFGAGKQTDTGAFARPVGPSSCCSTFLLFPPPPPPFLVHWLSRQPGVFTERESESLDCEPENNRGKNGKLCQGLWGKNIDVSNKGPACIGERGLHVRPDCVAFTHGEEMSAWYWPKFIL